MKFSSNVFWIMSEDEKFVVAPIHLSTDKNSVLTIYLYGCMDTIQYPIKPPTVPKKSGLPARKKELEKINDHISKNLYQLKLVDYLGHPIPNEVAPDISKFKIVKLKRSYELSTPSHRSIELLIKKIKSDEMAEKQNRINQVISRLDAIKLTDTDLDKIETTIKGLNLS